MQEHYKITKTKETFVPSYNLSNQMKHWGKIMGVLQMVPFVKDKGWAGNIGFRENEVIYVTPSGGMIDDIKREDIVGIKLDNQEIVYSSNKDKKPTSEWEIYWGIFNRRPEINAILHGHDLFALETADKLKELYKDLVGLTKGVTESGSVEFREEILECLTKTNTYLIGREHGFFALGKDFNEAGYLALEFRSRANKIMIGKTNYQEILDKYHIA